ncbi:MAG: pth, peptidyl-tRNA hydrolase [Candidatus Saccharibacteria bacterium]|nr:pth, peptidyl-tRNA hydrolase [Candidatus Saccharibacteria bacterium]MDB5180869.1 pth, peptidyl-tRNA hydrolase [Candidatus Saccharibacteria bacterium]
MKLLFAQGNPGRQYARTRHNTGFIALDALAEAQGGTWRTQEKFRADIAEISLQGEKILLVKPLSFYNETGQVARGLVDFYKLNIAGDVLVIHDELALPFGTIRVREKGSDAGNNGIKSLNAHLGQSYARIRIGIWNERRDSMNDADFVLSAFSEEEIKQLHQLIETKITELIEAFVKGDLEPVSHTLEA